MPKWKVKFTSEAKEDLKGLDDEVRKRVIKKLDWLQRNFDKITPLPLSGKWQGFFKLRVGKWRIIYKKDEERREIIVFVIGKRDKVYKEN